MTAAEKEYGGALYALAAEEHCEDAVLEGLTLAADAFRETPGYLKLVQNPAVPREERLAMLDEAFGAGVHVYVLNFLKILCGKHRAEIPNRNYFKSIVLKEPSKPETVKIIRMSDVELTPVEWLWKPYLPFGKLSVLQGNPGEGKTYFAMHLAAACTNGKLLPNMERMEPFNVIYQTAEDGLGDTVKPRLIEAGADLNRVLVIDDSDVQLTLSDEQIEKAIVENNARLVIIDPIQAYLGSDVDMNRANEVRPIFMRLGQVAQRTGCAILLIGHLNKAAGMQSLQRGLGSIDIAAAVRSVMFIGKLKHDPTMRILTHEKSSLAPP